MEQFWLTFLSIASLHLVSVISPGPDFFLVTNNALLYQRRTAVYTAFGISLGILVHITYCFLGLAVVIAHSLVIFNIIKYSGALYLFYLGIKALLAKENVSPSSNNSDHPSSKTNVLSNGSAVKQGFLCNVLNPKATIFFLGVFSLAIHPDTPMWQQVFLGVWMYLVTFIWFGFLAYLITHPYSRAVIFNIQPYITKIMGVLLIFFGIILILY